MSGYRNYVPWKTNYSSKKDSTPKYESSYGSSSTSVGRNRSDATKKTTDDDKGSGSTTSRIAQKYTGAYNSGYQRDSTATRDVGYTSSGVSRLKSNLEKKDTSHPPVTYRPIARTGARSRDPSPISQSEKSSSSSSYNLNRLCPKPYSRSVSRERTESTSSSSNLPKYSLRATSVGKDELSSKYGRSREDLSPKYSGRSAETSRYGGRSSTSTKDDTNKTSRFPSSRTSSREDLSSGSQKYITSRFLPKNSVEKSYTAYTRPSTTRANESIRKNRELLNVLHAQYDNEKNSRSPSRCSSVTPDDCHREKPNTECIKNEDENVELETITVITRGTSPSQTTQSTSFLRSRRVEVAKIVEKQITRPKIRKNMVDKEIQSDRLDDSTKSSRFAGASRISATPWSSFLDMKFSSPGNKKEKESSHSRGSESPKSISRTSSSKSLTQSQIKQSEKNKDVKGKSPSPTSSKGGKISPPKTVQNGDKKLLPPQIPKNESSNKPHSSITQNKDFRKSVLNMNPDGKTKKIGRRSNSVSSADSDCGEAQLSEATDVSENLTSCKSNSVSKLPQRITDNNKTNRNRRSPSSDASSSSSTTASGSEDDTKFKNESNLKKLKSAGSSRTSVAVSSADELSMDKSPKPPLSPRQTPPQSKDVEAKSFLMRALAPVTNLFKHKHQEPVEEPNFENFGDNSEDASLNDVPSISITSTTTNNNNINNNNIEQDEKIFKRVESGEKAWWLEDDVSQRQSSPSITKKQLVKPSIKHIPSGEIPWWLDQTAEPPEGVQTWPNYVPKEDNLQKNQSPLEKPVIRHIPSGEIPWWLDQNSEPPEGVQTWPNYIVKEDSSTDEGIVIYKIAKNNSNNNSSSQQISSNSNNQLRNPTIKHVESGEAPWWLDESAEVPEGLQTWPNYVKEDGTTEDGRVVYKMRHNDSNDSSWWIDSSETTSSNNKNKLRSNQQSIMDQEYLDKHKIRHIDSGERAWWMNSSEDINKEGEITEPNQKYPIRHQKSGERAWWLENENENETKQSDDESENQLPLGDRASPEGLEMPRQNEGRLSPYDNISRIHKAKRPNQLPLFISKHTNIDDVLGGSCQMWSPLMDQIFSYQSQHEECTEVKPDQVRIHEGKGVQPPWKDNTSGFPKAYTTYGKLDDAALQLYKDGDYGSYLDLEASISEQQEEFEGFQSNKKNSIVLRTQLSVRVHTIIEKLLTSEGRELRRALFSLKQIFQEDKDLVHEFVQNDGLSCLIKVGSEADQNYQNYILRALGQVMLYVDGMNGVMDHNPTIQWLYSLISSKFRLVVKTALKLLLVFVEYTDSNCMLLIQAINSVDYSLGLLPWYNVMKLLKDFDSADTELLIYATTLINKVLNGVPDQDSYYDQTDSLEEQGIESIIQRYMSKPGTDLDLLQQFQIYEAVLHYEDGEDIGGGPIRHLDESIKKTLRSRQGSRKSVSDTIERRKSRRHSTGNTPSYGNRHISTLSKMNSLQISQEGDESSSSHSSNSLNLNNTQLNGSYKDSNKASDAGVTPALRKRRERAERQRSFMKEQQETVALVINGSQNEEDNNNKNVDHNMNGNYTNALQQRIANGNVLNRTSSRKDITPLMNAVNKLDSEDNLTKQPWILSMMYNKSIDEQNNQKIEDTENTNENERNLLLQLKRENTVKDLTQKLANQNILHSPSDENKVNRIGDMSGLISKAKEGLAKSKSKADVLKSPTNENVPKLEVKKSENELRWEELVSTLNRTLNLCDMDFTDLASDDEMDILAPATVTNGIPPPPPPLLSRENGCAPPPPPPSNNRIPPPVPNAPPVFGVNLQRYKQMDTKIPIKKNKKTVKLFWKEVRDDPVTTGRIKSGYIWDELNPVIVDTQKLEHLFESRAKDLMTKKQQEMNKNKEIIVLDPKRSNAINIGMTKLPPPRSIKTAILKMDATIMNREGIEKLLTMLPTEEERTKIQEAQAASPDLPLGSAEQFLLTLASISELPARLKLWAFKLDFENSEREIAEPLMDLKQGIEVLKVNKTFHGILSTLLSIGNFLNGNEVKGFQIEYLAKVPEVKDTVHKHSLLHHLCHIVMEKFPDATDLYSEIGAITRASKIDFDELTLNIQRLEADCKASWDHLKLIAKHDGSTMMKVKMSDFLADCAERIILVGIIHRRVMNRFHKFLLWLGIPLHQISDAKPNEFCRVVSEFALEYRTTRERVLQQLEKKANHRERNKTRGKMITDIGKFRTKEDRADAELRQLLGSDISDVESLQGTLPFRRTRRDNNRSFIAPANGHLTDGDDEILESLVKTATKGPSRTAPRERKRTRHADRKSLRRTLKNGLSEEEKKHLSAYIKGY